MRVGGVCQMLTFAYKVGGWVIANAYVSKINKNIANIKQSNIKSYLNSIYSFDTDDFELSKKHQNYLNFWSFLTSLVVSLLVVLSKKSYPKLKNFFYIYKQVIILLFRWVGLKKSYVIDRVGQQKSYVCLQGGWVGQKSAKNMLT